MAISTDETISTLNSLIETCKDGERGFRDAAEGITNPEIRSMFEECARERATFARELQNCVSRLGGRTETEGSFAGTMHRGWINLKEALTGRDNKAIINEAERGEDVAKEEFQKALEKDLPTDIRAIVDRQCRRVIEVHDMVRDLKRRSQVGGLEAETRRTMRGGGGGGAM
jgi:uncharacterized protein (TIGR02284 family)